MHCIYEVILHFDPARIDAYDEWLHEHVREMLRIDGFLDAHVFAIETEPEASAIGRVVQYQLSSRSALEAYKNQHAERMRNEGLRRFGNHVKASRRVLLPCA